MNITDQSRSKHNTASLKGLEPPTLPPRTEESSGEDSDSDNIEREDLQ
jgi:hypothetical protein